ncbi:MAG: kinase [Pseudomonadota bacterium]|nr:kinase [Pseudomonadota bacterium]
MTGISKRDGKASQFNAFLNKYQDSSFSLALLKKMETFRVSTNLSPIVVSVSGAPGTGKTTLANELAKAFKQFFGINSAIVSLDDFYLSRAEREELAESIHPLAITRGPPGTHDVERLIDVIKKLRTNLSARAPVFNKALDERVEETRLLKPEGIIICEGWFWGAIAEPVSALVNPVNRLEEKQDHRGVWRKWVNSQIVRYKEAFISDISIHLRAPSPEASLEWRKLQEKENLAANAENESNISLNVERFLSHFERLVRWIDKDLPGRVDIEIFLDEHHDIARVSLR